MTLVPQINWKKLGVIFAAVLAGWGVWDHIYGDYVTYKTQRDNDVRQRVTDSLRRVKYKEEIEFRLRTLELRVSWSFCDSVKDALDELETKAHIKPKF